MGKKKEAVKLIEEELPAKAAAKAEEAGDEGHDDAAQDKELIKKMLAKHLGEEPSEEVMKNANEGYEAACGSGMKHEEACEAVAQAMKMAKAMAAHQAKKEAAAKDEAPKAEEAKKEDECVKDEKECKEAEEVKESAKPADSELLKLRGENAALKETIRKRELKDYVDAKLAETKVARAATKTIRESLEGARSEAEVDQKISMFLEGFKAGSEAGSGWIEGAEKTEGVKAGVSFADCLN